MKRIGPLLPAAALVLQWMAAATAAAQDLSLSNEQMTRLGIDVERPTAVRAMTIATGPAEVVVPPARQRVASAPLGGLLSRLLVATGERVEQGQVVAELESPELLEWQRAFLEAESEEQLAAQQLERDRALVSDGIVAERRLAEARARHRAATIRLDQARQQLEMAGFDDAAIGDLSRHGSLTARLELRAPIGGVVTFRHADPGSRLAASDPILSFADLREVWVEMQLSAERAAFVEPGMLVVLPAGAGGVAAEVTLVGEVVDPDTQTVLVRAVLDNPDRRLRAGQFFVAEIVDGSLARGGFSLPASSVVRNGDVAYVFVRRAEGFSAIPVEPVFESDRVVLIAEGIDAEAQVAVRGTSTLKSLWLAAGEESP